MILSAASAVAAQPGPVAISGDLAYTAPRIAQTDGFNGTGGPGLGVGVEVELTPGLAGQVRIGAARGEGSGDGDRSADDEFTGEFELGMAEVGMLAWLNPSDGTRFFLRGAIHGVALRVARLPSTLDPEEERTARGAGLTLGAGVEVSTGARLGIRLDASASAGQVQGVVASRFSPTARNGYVIPRLGIGLVWRP